MSLAIGSTNKVKVEALRETIPDYPDLAGLEVISLGVSSEISEQPMSLEETILGAKNRARNALQASPSSRYGVGIESGLFVAEGSRTGYLEACICSVFDGQNYYIGLSCGFEVPPSVLHLVLHQKMDLTQACFHSGVSTDPKLGMGQGLIGILSKGRVDRKRYCKQAIVTALIQLENSKLY
ncbi:MAG: inosine/xanthosine triphosphatase [Verrucomicrobia bacterium]|nr:inosine/xanthosine triphosphatase [Verrucomicrobiota bacterium]